MPSVISVEEAMSRRWNRNNGNFRTQFLGEDRHRDARPDPTRASPIAYLVEQGPHKALRAHFHEADQFQIFVDGAGRIGAHPAVPGKGHFVGPYSGYGPIVGGDTGVAYMTLRNAFDPGAQFLPENIEKVRAKRFARRELVFEVPAPLDDAALGAWVDSAVTPLIEAQPDGLAAASYRLAADCAVTGPDTVSGGGQFWLVMAGQMIDAAEPGRPLHRLSMTFVAPGDPPLAVRSGRLGLHVLFLQFPLFEPPAPR